MIATLPIFSTLEIVNLGNMTAKIHITKTRILTIATIITTMAISHEEESVMFMVKKVVILASI